MINGAKQNYPIHARELVVITFTCSIKKIGTKRDHKTVANLKILVDHNSA